MTEYARLEARILEIPEASIAVNKHRQFERVYCALDHLDELVP